MTAPLRVSRLYRYPMKGVAPVSVGRLELDEVGPVGDRRWMVASPDGERFIGQRDHPSMTALRASLPAGGGLTLEAAGHPPVTVPEPSPAAPRLTVPIWGDRVEAVVASDEGARWLSRFLGEEVTLVRLPDDTLRPVDPERAVEGFPSRVAFADDEPLHLVGEASVRDLDARVGDDGPRIEVERFRPNVVVEGAAPWAEDRWRRIRLGSVELAFVQPRARCVVTTIDPETGRKGPEPLATLNRYRRADGNVWVGQNAVHDGPGVLRVGDAVEVLEVGDPRPDPDVAETIPQAYQ